MEIFVLLLSFWFHECQSWGESQALQSKRERLKLQIMCGHDGSDNSFVRC